MYFESEQHYNECMAAQAEGESYNDAEESYYNYLGELLDNREFDLYALETCLDLLNSRSFKQSGQTAQEFLTHRKQMIQSKKDLPVENIGEMPF